MIGQTISRYAVRDKLGEGGMGVVYRAEDTRLNRPVAIKVLRADALWDPDRKRRFIQEAKAASALNHPGIVTIYDIDADHGVDFIAMEWVEGQPLDRLLASRALSMAEALSYATQIADALGAAHAAGIVHRDIKPANVMITSAGRAKVLDFGLAKLHTPAETDGALPTATASHATGAGVVLGTAAYMSPEQAEGLPVDARSDVFSLGAVMYEMFTGVRAFRGQSRLSTLSAILKETPPKPHTVRHGVPAAVEAIVLRSLDKNPTARFASAGELARVLAALTSRPAPAGLARMIRRPAVAAAVAATLVAVVSLAVWEAVQGSRRRWAVEVALPEIARLAGDQRFFEAAELLRQAERYVPEHADVRRYRAQIFMTRSIETTPAGAEVFIAPYRSAASAAAPLGVTPLRDITVPFGHTRWRIVKPGFEPVEATSFPAGALSFTLDPVGARPPEMVRVPGGPYQFRSAAPVGLDDYLLDRYEVTNREFKRFVDAGGYRRREFWKQPFVDAGRVLSWDEAMARFRDATGRPGPATWELGTYPEGRDDYPVNGVSWYEAAAYAEFAGKRLPTVYHWNRAAGLGLSSDILALSNFGGKGPARAGAHQGLAPFGTYDMAGNVKEWCWNESGGGRYILGGAWGDWTYTFGQSDSQAPMKRLPTYGFRCAKYAKPLADGLTAPIATLTRDYSKEKPVADDVFRVYRSLYAYDRRDVRGSVDAVDDTSPHWRQEKVSYEGPPGTERIPGYLFLPKNASPPFQTVVYFPGSNARTEASSANLGFTMLFLDFFIRSGRAVMYPIYRDTYERDIGPVAAGSPTERDLVVHWAKEVSRTVDYLETRPDVDRAKIAFAGLSLGALWAPVFTAVEPRFTTSLIIAGGLDFPVRPAEVEPINFAPRVTLPTLMISGRDDFRFPLEMLQRPLFERLGTPREHKRHALVDSGHVPPRNAILRESLDWLDRYLGPVTTR
jgi:dienelactone hydrolase/predicted Ser/Thr protein kinase